MKLPREFYTRRDTETIARELLGKLLVVPAERGQRVAGMIVETEAYLGVADRAAHSFGGRRTTRNEAMYLAGGHAYVFFVYGMHFQFNVVTAAADEPQAVLIRAVEPVDGVELMRLRRNGRATIRSDVQLTSGPGKLAAAFGIDRSYNGEDLLGERVWLEEFRPLAPNEVMAGARVGVGYAGEDARLPLRFWIAGNRFVSKSRG
jgi:DNA-3-methyladenine glycosylase